MNGRSFGIADHILRFVWSNVKIFWAPVVIGALLVPAGFAQRDVRAVLVPVASRKAAPGFRLISDTGKSMQNSDYLGKVILLNFWATDCGGCVLEIPSFIEIEKDFGGKGFTAVGISMDISYEDLKDADEAWKRVRPFAQSHKMNYPILMGDKLIEGAYNVDEYPATYLIDKKGRVAARYVGIIDKADVEANVKRLLVE